MVKKNVSRILRSAAVFLLILGLSWSEALASNGREVRFRSLPTRHKVFIVRGERYHYYGGRFYRPWFLGFTVVLPPIGAIVTTLPFGHRTIIVAGAPYYYYDGAYYRPYHSGYIIVPAPVVNSNAVATTVVVQPQASSGNTVFINVPNSNGSYTPVMLVKQKDGYLGPQGEYYPGNPTVDELKALYGK